RQSRRSREPARRRRRRRRSRRAAARRAEAASRAPGPLTNPVVLAALAAVTAYGGTTLEQFDGCSYRWFVDHELDPVPLDPTAEPLIEGGLVHDVLQRLYEERPGGDPLPRPGSLAAWSERGRRLLAERVAERAELGEHPVERAMVRRAGALLQRFLAEEAERDTGGFEPWRLEARFGGEPESEEPALDLGGWALHGAIDRVDRAADGRAVVIDYKVAGSVTPRAKFEEEAKLQLPLYLLAVERWGTTPAAGLYHPLRGTSDRRPRGVVAAGARADLRGYGLVGTDVVEDEELGSLLEEARERAGAIVARMRGGDIRRDPGPRQGLRGHDVCPSFCAFAPICRRDRAPRYVEAEECEEG
ncbi:MAG: PD-(D/E)XK nuclease family protein, partial [Syntrophothermus sp.]